MADTALALDLGENVRIQAYADDFILIIKGGNRLRLEDHAHRALQQIDEWSLKYKLQFSIEKTKLILFPKGTKLHRSPSRIKWKGIPIPRKDVLKYLGFVLDSKTTWIPHLSTIKDRTQIMINKLNNIVSRTWNMKGKLIKIISNRAIERMILYGCPIWHTGTARQKQKLLQIQRGALLSITKAYATTPTSALQVLSGILPLDLRAEMERQMYRLIHFKEDTRIGYITIWAHEVEERLPALHMHSAKIIKTKWDKDPPQGKDLETYTDGSKMENKVGAAFVAFLNNEEIHREQYRLNDEATVFQAEVLALKRALLWIDQRTENTLRIFTDSLSTLQSLNSIEQRSRSIISLKEMIHTIRDNKDLEINWIKAHDGNKGNESADEEAKRTTQRSSIDITVLLPEQSAKSKILQETLRTWQERWEEEETGRETYKYYPRISLKRLRADHLLAQIFTNHGRFPSYMSRFHKQQVRCACGTNGSLANAAHYLHRCPQLTKIRAKILPRIPSPEILTTSKRHLAAVRELMKIISDPSNNLIVTT
ncbi:uncharacterized protein LOC118179409 [Stegodyphus dumicola]|uniref:uncharacterized protein LOC118179409 n=1 Tax=Stegodyphus dumicola TaxID=202533 RepID=UPI0015AFDA8E|nr:uncharacterized protein LOC118179409 [Stegodyphus dumicola]